MLTEEKVAAGFKAAGERMNTIESTQAEFRTWTENFIKQMHVYGKAMLTGNTENGQSYRSFWGSEERAKQFGELFLHVLGKKDMSGIGQAEGSALVQDELLPRMIQMLGVYGKFRKNATIVPMSNSTATVPMIQSDMTIYCPGEGAEIDKSDMKFNQIALVPRKFAGLAAVSSELMEDSVVGLGEILGISFARSLAKKEDEIGFLGDGTSAYFGMAGICGVLRAVSNTISEIAGLIVGTGNVYNELTLDNFQDVVGILPEGADENAKWYCSKRFYYNCIWKLAREAGVANIFEILSDRKSKYFLGYEVEFVSAMPSAAANSQICAILGDLQFGAYLAERRMLTVDRSSDVLFKNDQIAVRATERVAINTFGVGDKTNPGAIVGLITAAS